MFTICVRHVIFHVDELRIEAISLQIHLVKLVYFLPMHTRERETRIGATHKLRLSPPLLISFRWNVLFIQVPFVKFWLEHQVP